MKPILALLFGGLLLPGLSATGVTQQLQKVTSRAIWGPGIAAMQEIRDHCGRPQGEPVGDCLYSMMEKDGASPEALAFTKQTGNLGYLRDLLDLGPVAVAFVHYPFRASEHQGALIVNGAAVIDIDQQSWLATEEMRRNLTYSTIAERSPLVLVGPGDRNGNEYIGTKRLPAGGVRITAGYSLRNGCQACEILGSAIFAFDFERSGRFLGTKLLGVTTQKTVPKPLKQ